VGVERAEQDAQDDYDHGYGGESLFSVQPTDLVLGPGESAPLLVRFAELCDGLASSVRFRVFVPGPLVEHPSLGSPSAVELTCRAVAVGPVVDVARKDRASSPTHGHGVASTGMQQQQRQPSDVTQTSAASPSAGGGGATKRPQVVQFGDVRLGASLTHVVTLTNRSRTVAARFEFLAGADGRGAFTIQQPRGSIPAGGTRAVAVSFAPPAAGNFHRRVAVAVADGAPRLLDLLGTGYDEKRRPLPLRMRHVDAARLRPPQLKLAHPDTVSLAVKQGAHVDPAAVAAAAELTLLDIRQWPTKRCVT
jgi:hypothetical protein